MEVIDLSAKRKEVWLRKLEEMRELGGVAVFGSVGEQDATILPFPLQRVQSQLEVIPDEPA